MGIKSIVQRLTRPVGYDIIEFDRFRLFKHFGINLIFDVGANVGQYATEMRSLGYQGRIISFEPLTREFQTVLKRARGDKLWEVVNQAVGEFDGTTAIHVARNSVSSSLLGMLPRHLQAAPKSEYAGSQLVQIVRLDSIFRDYYHDDGDRVLLKVDTQGYEYQVLQGAAKSLPSILGIQIEMSLAPLYVGQKLFGEMLPYVTNLGFSLMSIETGFRDETTGQTLDMDGLFFGILKYNCELYTLTTYGGHDAFSDYRIC